MRKVIDDINKGQIDRNFGTLTIGVSAVEHTLRAGTTCEGSFSVSAPQGAMTSGYVHATDYRMECINPRLSGNQDEIAYRFHAEHMLPGEDVHGNFVLLTNRGEYLVPFNVHVEADVFDSSVGPIRNLFHFTNLAKAKWGEALEMFYSPGFAGIFNGPDREWLSVYRALSGVRGSEHNLDEFLIAAGRKTPVEYIPSESAVEITDPEGVARYSLTVSRNGWGYTHFGLECDGDFITLEDREAGFGSFLGNKYRLYYYIDSSKLHNGRNFGSITLNDHRQKVVIPVVVNRTGAIRNLRSMARYRSEKVVRLMELYADHRLRKLPTISWLRESTVVVDDMLAHDPEDVMARLYRIHLMITQEHANEAVWNLRNVRDKVEAIKKEHTYLWCYYLYLNSLVDDNPLDAGTLTEEVEYCYRSDPDNWRLCWLLSVMGEEYGDPGHKWEMFAESFRRGCISPAVYVEAARLVLDNPVILGELDGFGTAVVRYLCKKGVMNQDVLLVVRSLAENCREYSPRLINLLSACHDSCPDDELLGVICAQLIKGNRTDARANSWYELGVKKGIKITRLFEYYMMSVDKAELKDLPRPVLMYFSYQSDLDYETNAFLYAVVVRDRDRDPGMYSRYVRQIKDYVLDQLRARHNNRYLAMLYRHVIDDLMLTSDEVAKQLADVILLHEADLTGRDDARRLILCYDFRDVEEVYPVVNGRAYAPVYSEGYSAVIEDDEGNRHVFGSASPLTRLIPPGKLMLSLQLLVTDHAGMDAYLCLHNNETAEIRPENEFRFLNLMRRNYFGMEYARNLTMNLMRFYHERDRMQELDALLENLRPDQVPDLDRSECIRLLAERGQYTKAMEWLHGFGPEGLDRNAVSELLYSWLPTGRDDEGKYTELICQLLIDTLESGNTNTVSMQYLMDHATASMKTFRSIWLKAGEISADRRDLDERLIIQTLYTGTYFPEKTEVITEYAYGAPDPEVLRAALVITGYADFVEEETMPDAVYGIMTDAYETGLKPGRFCDLSYVRYFAGRKEKLDDRSRSVLKDCLHRLLAAEVMASCFKDLSDVMPSMAPYANATIVEYRTTPGTAVTIHYVTEGAEDYAAEPMNEVCDGVYSRMFIIFYDETADYYVTEGDDEGEEKLTGTGKLTRREDRDATRGRFGLIDEMCRNRAFGDYEAVDGLMEEYYRKDYMVDRLFSMHRNRDRE